jgi:hypothetical protein
MTKTRTITPNERILARNLQNRKTPIDMDSLMNVTGLTKSEIDTANTHKKTNVLMPDFHIIRTGKWGVNTKYKLLDDNADPADIVKNFDFFCKKAERAFVEVEKASLICRDLAQYRTMQLQLQTMFTRLITNVSIMQMGNLPASNI